MASKFVLWCVNLTHGHINTTAQTEAEARMKVEALIRQLHKDEAIRSVERVNK